MGVPTRPPFQIGQVVTCVRASKGQGIVNGHEYEIVNSSNPYLGNILVTLANPNNNVTQYFAARFCINGLGHIDDPCMLCGQHWGGVKVDDE